MRYFLLVILFAIFPHSLFAATYTNPDGSTTRIDVPAELSPMVEKTLSGFIDSILPRDIVPLTEAPDGEANNPKNWEYDVKVKRIFSDTKMTSLLIEYYQYSGGAHGSFARMGIVLDNTTGKRIEIQDLFNGKKLARRLSPIWQNRVRTKLEGYLGAKLSPDEKNWIRDGSNDIQNYQWFTITKNTISFYGQQYQHGAYAYGMQTLIVPLTMLQDIRK